MSLVLSGVLEVCVLGLCSSGWFDLGFLDFMYLLLNDWGCWVYVCFGFIVSLLVIFVFVWVLGLWLCCMLCLLAPQFVLV